MRRGTTIGALAFCALLGPAVAAAQGRCVVPDRPLASAACEAPYPAPDLVFWNPGCDYVAGPYPDTEAVALPHQWPLPGGATLVGTNVGLGQCHSVITVRHRSGRPVSTGRAVDLGPDGTSCVELRRLAVRRRADAFTVGASLVGAPGDVLSAAHVEQIAAAGSYHLTLDVAVQRSTDLALLAPLADRIVSLRIRSFGNRIDMRHLPAIACLRAVAVSARSVSGIASLASSPGLQAFEVRASLADEEVENIAALASLRELRVWPRSPRSFARFSAVRQIERLHTRAHPRLLEAFAHAPLRRLVLEGPAGLPVLRAASHFTDLKVLDVVLSTAVRGTHRLGALAALGNLETLVIAFWDVAPRLPPMPSLRRLVVSGSVDERFVRWMRRQPELREVQTVVTDEQLGPRLPRAVVRTIARDAPEPILDDGEDVEDPLAGFLL